MASPFLSGLSSNPNASPMRPSYGMTPNPNQGIGSIQEILAGLNTLQTNTPGMPTNTAPQYGLGQFLQQRLGGNGATKNQFSSIQDMIDAGYDWRQIYSLASQGGYGVNANDYYRARQAGGGVTNPNQPGGATYVKPQPGYGEGQVASWSQQGNHLATPRYGYGMSTGVPQPAPAAAPAPVTQPRTSFRGGY
jgi:hypothetical protein